MHPPSPATDPARRSPLSAGSLGGTPRPSRPPALRAVTGAVLTVALVALAGCGGDDTDDASAGDAATTNVENSESITSTATGATDADPAGETDCTDEEADTNDSDEQVEPEYSELWDITYHDSYKVLTVPNSEFPDQPDLHYVLVQCGAPEPELEGDLADAAVFEVPVERTAINHANGLAMLDQLGVTDTIVGMSDNLLSYPDDPWYSEIIESASDPQNLGGNTDAIEYEATLGVEPDVLVMAGYGPGYSNVADQVDRGLPAIMVANRLEPTPLGSSEWMKFLSAFYNAEAEADAAFEEIEQAYAEAAETVEGTLSDDYEAAYLCLDPDVGCEFTYSHGADTLNGRILETLGVNNPFAEGNDAGNGMNFDFEQSLARAADADFFIVYDRAPIVAELLANDDRYSNFAPLADNQYIAYLEDPFPYCQANLYVRVDILIRDYAIGMAPDLFPGDHGECFATPATNDSN